MLILLDDVEILIVRVFRMSGDKLAGKNSISYQLLRSSHVKSHWLRLGLVFFALLNVASHLFASPGATAQVTFWLETEVAFYIIIGIIYLLGLRMWYVPALLYSVFNLAAYLISAFVILPGITTTLLVGHIQFAQYGYGRGISMVAWVYLIIAGILAIKYDKGSKLNKLLLES